MNRIILSKRGARFISIADEQRKAAARLAVV